MQIVPVAAKIGKCGWKVMDGVRINEWCLQLFDISVHLGPHPFPLRRKGRRSLPLSVARRPEIAYEQNGEWYFSYALRASIYCNKKLYKEAILDTDKALNLNPSYHRVHFLWGYAKLGLEMFDEAMIDAQKAVDLDANDGENYYLLGRCHLAKGDKIAAKRNFVKAKGLNFDTPEFLTELEKLANIDTNPIDSNL